VCVGFSLLFSMQLFSKLLVGCCKFTSKIVPVYKDKSLKHGVFFRLDRKTILGRIWVGVKQQHVLWLDVCGGYMLHVT